MTKHADLGKAVHFSARAVFGRVKSSGQPAAVISTKSPFATSRVGDERAISRHEHHPDRRDLPLAPYDRATFYTFDAWGYMDYPFYQSQNIRTENP